MNSFDHILITAPNEKIAIQYYRQLQDCKVSLRLHHCIFDTIADPQGNRVGSGGGTLNALDYLVAKYGKNNIINSRILIIHSGGDSRRAPLHSICGKAWASINGVLKDSANSTIANPLMLLIIELQKFCRSLPQSSLVVASSDVLLDFCIDTEMIIAFPMNNFSIVAVPEIATVAKNHGVLVLSNNDIEASKVIVEVASNYLQKPSVTTIQDLGGSFDMNGLNCAYIDTGVVIATGEALFTLVSMLYDVDISKSTSSKIYSLENTPSTSNGNSNTETIVSSLRLELYSDFLHALVLKSGQCTFEEYLNRLQYKCDSPYLENFKVSNSIYERSIAKVWDKLFAFTLFSIAIPSGLFYHLGTSKEFLDLLVFNSNTSSNDFQSRKLKQFVEKYQMNASVVSINNTNSNNYKGKGNILIGSILHNNSCDNKSKDLSQNNVIEYSLLSGNFCIGKNSIVSHVDGKFGKDLIVKDNILLQQIYIQHPTYLTSNTFQRVFIIFGIKDDMKLIYSNPNAQLCGVSWKNIFSHLGIHPNDIWTNVPETDRTLWTAKLFMVLNLTSDCSIPSKFLLWPQYLSQEEDLDMNLLNEIRGFIHQFWKESLRISLSECLGFGLAGLMYDWRKCLHTVVSSSYRGVATIPSTETVMNIFNSSHIFTNSHLLYDICRSICGFNNQDSKIHKDELDLAFEYLINISDESITIKVISMLFREDDIKELATERFAKLLLLCARLAERLLSYSHSLQEVIKNAFQFMIQKTSSIHSLPTCLLESYDELVRNCDSIHELFEVLAQKIIEIQVSSSLDSETLFMKWMKTSSLSLNNKYKVFLAQAAVRIDLAGGWSDTPPICYDIGGAVTNVAIRIDGRRSIQCVSRCLEENESRNCRIILHSLRRQSYSFEGDHIVCKDDSDFKDLSNPLEPCNLLKACMLSLGIATFDKSNLDNPLSLRLFHLIGGSLEVACVSDLPAGSGMGGSSVLAATILKSIASLCCFDLSNDRLVALTTLTEQYMHTGGGWQDQVGSIFGGFKIGRSKNQLPLYVKVEELDFQCELNIEFSSRTFLIYTGQQRLAKNTLINALRRYAIVPYPDSSQGILSELRFGAEECFSILLKSKELTPSMIITELAKILRQYWELKKKMAYGSEPEYIAQLFDHIAHQCEGYSLCGAGGGGYAVVIVKEGITFQDITISIEEFNSHRIFENANEKMSTHSIEVDTEGIQVITMNNSQLSSIENYFK